MKTSWPLVLKMNYLSCSKSKYVVICIYYPALVCL